MILRPDTPVLDDEEAARMQDAHMAYLADLSEAGHLLAAGPPFHETFRGLSSLNVDPDRARALTEQDPAVMGGRFSAKVIALVPAGAVSFSRTHLPRSMSEVDV